MFQRVHAVSEGKSRKVFEQFCLLLERLVSVKEAIALVKEIKRQQEEPQLKEEAFFAAICREDKAMAKKLMEIFTQLQKALHDLSKERLMEVFMLLLTLRVDAQIDFYSASLGILNALGCIIYNKGFVGEMEATYISLTRIEASAIKALAPSLPGFSPSFLSGGQSEQQARVEDQSLVERFLERPELNTITEGLSLIRGHENHFNLFMTWLTPASRRVVLFALESDPAANNVQRGVAGILFTHGHQEDLDYAINQPRRR